MLNGRLPYNDRDIRTLIEQTKSKPRFSSRINVTPGMLCVHIREIIRCLYSGDNTLSGTSDKYMAPLDKWISLLNFLKNLHFELSVLS